MTLLRVNSLHMHFPVYRGIILRRQIAVLQAVSGVSFDIAKGKTLGLVGESGCGKSTLGRAVIRLYRPTAGEVWFDGVNIATVTDKQLKKLRCKFQMIFQDPYASLNPRWTVFDIIAEPLVTNAHHLDRAAVKARVVEVMDRVCLATKFIKRYPHEFSGGQRQRIAIARALALNPQLVICDEPVSALDVSIQSQILNLLVELQRELQLSYLFISHDLSAVKHIADRIAVMYLGKVVELANSDELFAKPQHPYSKALIDAVPHPDPRKERIRKRIILKGDLPDPMHPPTGCAFNSRCPEVFERCYRDMPKLSTDSAHCTACHLSR